MALRLGVPSHQPPLTALALLGHQLHEVLHGLGRHQRSLMLLVPGLPAGALARGLLLRTRAARPIGGGRARGVARVLRQLLLQLRHPLRQRPHQRQQLRNAFVPLGQLGFQLRDSGLFGVY